MSKHSIRLVLVFSLMSFMAYANETRINIFHPASYHKILDQYQGKAFTLVFWSVFCSPCIRELERLGKNKTYMSGTFIFVSTDGDNLIKEVQRLIEKTGLQNQQHWVFSAAQIDEIINTVDSQWYGEVPRNYFFDDEHNRIRLNVLE